MGSTAVRVGGLGLTDYLPQGVFGSRPGGKRAFENARFVRIVAPSTDKNGGAWCSRKILTWPELEPEGVLGSRRQVDHWEAAGKPSAAQLQELKALRKQVKEGQTMSVDEPAVQKLDVCMPKNPLASPVKWWPRR